MSGATPGNTSRGRGGLLIAARLAAISCVIALLLPSSVLAAGPSRARFTAEADAVCAAGATALQAQRGALDGALSRYTSHDTPKTRATLAADLAKFFYTSWTNLQQLIAMPAPSADRATLERYLVAWEISLSVAKPFIEAVTDDLSSVVVRYANAIGAYTAVAGRFAAQYGFFVCGAAASTYELRIHLAGARRVVPGTQVRLLRGRDSVRGVCEVLASVHAHGGTAALVVLRPSAAPLHRGAGIQVHGAGAGLYLTVADGAASGPALPSGSIIGAS